jgi:oligopeptide transport system substrate-binding protein
MVLSQEQQARFGISSELSTLDPRLSKGLANSNIINMLYEGLTRVDRDGKVLPGLAENIHVSPDMQTYTFVLKDAKWSNGDQITAKDFEMSWNAQRKPEFNAPNTYLFSVIKEGDAAIKATDDKTLVVQLVNPTPYFLQLVATPAFFPVHQKWVQEHPDSTDGGKLACVCNGPYTAVPFTKGQTITLIKNDNYSGKAAVKLAQVTFSPNDDYTNFSMYQKGLLDWAGAPLSVLPQDSIEALKKAGDLKSEPAAGTQFLRLNVEIAPFNNTKMRHALCLAVDAQTIIDTILQGEQKLATSFVPPELGLPAFAYFVPNDLQGARAMFEDALQELQMKQEMLPQLSLTYMDSGNMQKIAESIQKNIKNAFNLDIILKELPREQYYQAMTNKDYMVSLGSWFADYFDPMSFLSIFQYKENGTNNTGWSNSSYTHLLERSCMEMDQQRRLELLSNAQEILMQEMPTIPLYHYAFIHVRSEKLQGVLLSPLGQLNLEESYIVDMQQ